MPASLKDLRSRIKSVAGTKKITKAMQLVAAAKLGKAQSAVSASRAYADGLSLFISQLGSLVATGYAPHPLMTTQPESRVAVLFIMSSDRGLCGGFNANVCKQALRAYAELEKQGYTVKVVSSGRKAFQFFLNRFKTNSKTPEKIKSAQLVPADFISHPSALIDSVDVVRLDIQADKPTHGASQHVADALAHLYTEGKIGKVAVVFTHFKSVLTQTPQTKVLLPIQIEEKISQEGEPLFEPQLEDLLPYVIPRYMVSCLFQYFLESIASEHGSRMTAMDSATRNAQSMERKLQLYYQRARQAAITKELIEIISGAQAL